MSLKTVFCLALASAGVVAGVFAQSASSNGGRVFELRTYTTNPGKLDALQARFRNHTMRIFEKHGMTNIGYWVPQDKPDTLVYIIAHASRDAAKKNWNDFRNDPEWQKVQKESEANGKLVTHVDSVYMDPADYSPLR